MKPVINESGRSGARAMIALMSVSLAFAGQARAGNAGTQTIPQPTLGKVTHRVDALNAANYSEYLSNTLLSPVAVGGLRLAMSVPYNGPSAGSDIAGMLDPENAGRTIILQRGTSDGECRVIYRSDFDSSFQDSLRNEWSYGDVRETPDGRRFLGTIGNGSTTLTVDHAPQNGNYVIQFDLLAIGDWKGNSAPRPQVWGLRIVDGPTLIETNFATVPGSRQAYPDTVGQSDFEPGFQAIETFTGPDGKVGTVYRLAYRFERTAAASESGSDDVRVEFYSRGLDSGANAPVWGLTNVVLALVPDSGGAGGGGGGSANNYFGVWDRPAFAMAEYGMQPAGSWRGGGGSGEDEPAPSTPKDQSPAPVQSNPTQPEWNHPPVVQIPAPGSVLVFGLGGLLAGRRRR